MAPPAGECAQHSTGHEEAVLGGRETCARLPTYGQWRANTPPELPEAFRQSPQCGLFAVPNLGAHASFLATNLPSTFT